MKGFISFLVGLLLGGLVGSVVAILVAPTSGAELRGQIQDRAQRMQTDVKEGSLSSTGRAGAAVSLTAFTQ